MVKFIPPPRKRPVGGFESTTEAVMAMVEQGGKTPRQIAEELDTSTETVRGIIQRARAERRTKGIEGLPPDRAAELREIYRRTVALISEARGVEAETLHALFRGTHIKNTPTGSSALIAPSDSDDDPAGGEEETPSITPSPSPQPQPEKPMITSKIKPLAIEPVAGGQVYLKNRATGAYLHMSGEIMTMDKSLRWKGTPSQALACKRKFPLAEALSMVRAELLSPKPQENI